MLIVPLLFSIYAEMMTVEAMEDLEEGFGWELLKDVNISEDQLMVVQSESELQTIIHGLKKTENKYEMKINFNKIKVMSLQRRE